MKYSLICKVNFIKLRANRKKRKTSKHL